MLKLVAIGGLILLIGAICLFGAVVLGRLIARLVVREFYKEQDERKEKANANTGRAQTKVKE